MHAMPMWMRPCRELKHPVVSRRISKLVADRWCISIARYPVHGLRTVPSPERERYKILYEQCDVARLSKLNVLCSSGVLVRSPFWRLPVRRERRPGVGNSHGSLRVS